MPALSNPRHERFAQELACGKTADEAYVLAGYTENRCNASRLKATENIMKRLAELQGRVSEKTEVTLEWLLEKAKEVLNQAMQAGQNAAAVSAIKELGILSGNRVEKRENLNRSVNEMSDDELAAIARAGSEGASASPKRPALPH